MATPISSHRRRGVAAIAFIALAATAGVLLSSRARPVEAAASAAQPVGTPAVNWLERGEPFVRPGKLEPGDVVRVTLFGLFSPTGHDAFDLHVDPEGAITIPLLGTVSVRNLTTDRAASVLSAAEAKAQLQTDAIVTIGIVRKAVETKVRPGPLAPGDNLRISLFDITGPSNRLEVLAQVAEDGTITLPLVGAVKVIENTEAVASSTIAKAFQQKAIIENATVSVLKLDMWGLP